MFPINQSTKHEDLKTMLDRIKVIDDIITYNYTFNLPTKYEVWLNTHKDLIEELEFMIKQDLQVFNEMGN